MLAANAQALEKIMQKLRQLKGSLLSRDAYDRWSHASPEELAENQEAMSREDREVKVLQEKLKNEVVSFVDQNVFYVHYNPELYRSHFG